MTKQVVITLESITLAGDIEQIRVHLHFAGAKPQNQYLKIGETITVELSDEPSAARCGYGSPPCTLRAGHTGWHNCDDFRHPSE